MFYELFTPGTLIFSGFIAGVLSTLFFTTLFFENIKHQEDKNN